MPNQGGYRKPGNPAPVSGPGRLSRRTDGGPTQGAKYMGGGQYGESKQLMEQQQAAPMAAAPTRSAPSPKIQPVQAITPLTAPTQRPDEPLTAGMAFGAGPGPEALASNNRNAKPSQVIGKIIQYDETGQLSDFYNYLLTRGL